MGLLHGQVATSQQVAASHGSSKSKQPDNGSNQQLQQ